MVKKGHEIAPITPSILDTSAVIDIGMGDETLSVRDIVHGDRGKNMDKKTKADIVLRITGTKRTKKKYATADARKAAQAKRDKERREKKRQELMEIDPSLAPKRRGPKRTAEADKAYRQQYAADKYAREKKAKEDLEHKVKTNYKLAEQFLGKQKAADIKQRLMNQGKW